MRFTNLNPPQTTVGANSVRPFRSLTHLRKNPNHKTPPKRDVVFLQSRNCAAPLQFRIYGKPEHRRPQVAPTEMFCRRYMCGNGRTMFAPTINNHRRRRYLHSSFLIPNSSFPIPHSSLFTHSSLLKKGVDKRLKVCYSHINRFKCYDGNK